MRIVASSKRIVMALLVAALAWKLVWPEAPQCWRSGLLRAPGWIGASLALVLGARLLRRLDHLEHRSLTLQVLLTMAISLLYLALLVFALLWFWMLHLMTVDFEFSPR